MRNMAFVNVKQDQSVVHDAHNLNIMLVFVDFWIRCDRWFPSTVLRMLGEGGWEWTGPRFAFGIH